MFKGMYHGKQCHAADIPAVLARAWAAGVDRIIVRLSVCSNVPPVSSAPVAYKPALCLVRWQVTGGSLKESREALEIAETDGKP
jgi:TatD DNase family protein